MLIKQNDLCTMVCIGLCAKSIVSVIDWRFNGLGRFYHVVYAYILGCDMKSTL